MKKKLLSFLIGVLALGLFMVLLVTPYVKYVTMTIFLLIASYLAGKLITEVYEDYKNKQK